MTLLKNRVLVACCALAFSTFSQAQETGKLNLRFEARGDYQREYVDGDVVDDETGFKGKFLNFMMTGNLTKNLSYAFRHRLNKTSLNSSFFNATDFLYLDWRATDWLSLSAGKQIVYIGGYEYDRAPIDLYFCSEFWQQVPCYEWGVSAAYHFNNDADQLIFQVCESPFRNFAQNRDVYSYNLLWMGKHGFLSTLWSVNMIEYAKGKYINYIALGNEVKVSDQLKAEIDFMNRATDHQTFLLKDCSVMAEVSYMPTKKVNVFAKVTYDVNNTDNDGDYTVTSGSELTRFGGGVEFYPLADDRLRLHANYSYVTGTNTNPDGVLRNKQSVVDVGLTWRLKTKL
ncbi:MAG: porin [Prevotella sp.]|nr:porin [Prevotella sp.]